MTKILKLLLMVLLFSVSKLTGQEQENIVTTDVTNFWKAYDKMKTTNDSVQQLTYLKELFLDKGSSGLKAIMEARRYTLTEYHKVINKYPNFWKTLRPNTLKINSYKDNIEQGIHWFKKLYPEAKPAKIYFTVGAFRTGGTTMGNKVLIGSEIALANTQVNTSELKTDYPHLPGYFKKNVPHKSIVFTNVHEYVHTQQNTNIANSLLSRTLMEGVAEFIAEQALDVTSPNEGVTFGKKNDQKIKKAFVKEMFTKFEIMWFWGNSNNQFQVGDLGYYVGYAICKNYYKLAHDKGRAIKEMIELDYLDEKKVYQFIDDSKYFDKTIAAYQKEAALNRPRVVGIMEFTNNMENVDVAINTMTIEFSKRMNTKLVNLRLGPLGRNNLIEVIDNLGWSEDNKKVTFKIALKPNLRQQLLLTDIFRSEEGYLLDPFLIDITTK